jgi:hypothetical protein
MAESTLSITRADLLRHVGRFLGWGRAPNEWINLDNNLTDARDIIDAGLRLFYQPAGHIWSFLRPTFHFSTIPTKDTYDLPDDFGGLVEDELAYRSTNTPGRGVRITGDVFIRQLQQRDSPTTTGYPQWASILPIPSNGDEPQRSALTLWPTPDAEYELTGRYYSNPYGISESRPFPLGGQPHSETLVAAVLWAADREINDAHPGSSARYAQYMERLSASILFDQRTTGPQTFG